MTRPLLVIVVSRTRPDHVLELMRCWADTADGKAAMLLALDDDDPTLSDYSQCFTADAPDVPVLLSIGHRNGFAPRLSQEADAWALDYPYVASWGDDHRPRTSGWDSRLIEALELLGTGVAYGNDLVHGEAIPTAWAQTSDIVRALGWMTPPGLQHMFVDNAVKDIGDALGARAYLPDVVIEHVHPINGAAATDPLYMEGAAHMTADRVIYEDWKRHRFDNDVARIREGCGL